MRGAGECVLKEEICAEVEMVSRCIRVGLMSKQRQEAMTSVGVIMTRSETLMRQAG